MSSHRFLVGAALALAPLLPATSASAQEIRGVSPALPTSADEIRISIANPEGSCNYSIAVQGDVISVNLHQPSPECKAPPPPDPGLVEEVFLAPLPTGSYTLVVMSAGRQTDSRPILVQAPSSQLSLLQGRFTVNVTWMPASSGPAMAATAVQVSDGSGFFWFFNAESADLTVKMINAVALDSQYWFFASSATDQQYTITVTDTWLDQTVTYLSQAGLNQNILDFSSFKFLP